MSKVNFGTLYIKPFGYDMEYRFFPITSKHHMQVVDDEMRNPIDIGHWGQRRNPYFGVLGSKVKVKFETLPLKPCGHNTD